MAADLVPSSRVFEGDWYGAALGEFGGRVGSVVPRSYPAYVRILHPAGGEVGRQVPWSKVAAYSGTALHPLAQFCSLAGRWKYDPRVGAGWPGENPHEGTLELPQLQVLSGVLASYTTTPERCWFTVWDGYGNLPRAWERTVPQLRQPHRAYYIFERPVADVGEFSMQVYALGWDQDPLPSSMARLRALGPPASAVDAPHAHSDEPPLVQSPNQWWPNDRAWCVATEIDFDSTLVAGSRRLIDEISMNPKLEAFPVEPTDDLSINGDTINPLPPGPR